MSAFKVGQLVTCVDDSPRKGLQATVPKGQIYTIAEIFIDRYSGKPGLIIEGVKAPGTYRGFLPHRFRPCHPTDITQLRRVVAEAQCLTMPQDA